MKRMASLDGACSLAPALILPLLTAGFGCCCCCFVDLFRYETSAKDNINVEAAVRMLVRNILTHDDAFAAQAAAAAAASKTANIALGDTSKSDGGGCCG